MPLLHPKNIWNETGRWESAKEVMYQFEKDEKEFTLSFTHEEIVLDLIRKRLSSYRDLPIKIYHFSTKFRNEPRAKSGILRAREFIMKDLYSLHASQDDLDKYYWEVADAYKRIFKRMNLEAKVVEAAGGVFTENITHEFQVLSDSGEDTIFYCEFCEFAQNREVTKVKQGDKCPNCSKGKIKEGKAIEIGNIFRFGTVYSKKMNVTFSDNDGKPQFAYLGSYGIGITRLIGTVVELFHDDKGIIWPKEISPFAVHLIGLNKKADDVYRKLEEAGIEVIYDDREIQAGEKFKDADLIGIPIRLVVSDKTGDKIELKERTSEKTELVEMPELLKRLGV